jgi:hypothetical protein
VLGSLRVIGSWLYYQLARPDAAATGVPAMAEPGTAEAPGPVLSREAQAER